jgi:hypothetical protein
MACNAGPDIIEDGLTFCVDAANINSYPKTGTTWTDLVGGNNGTLINGPTFDSDNRGSIVFDGTDDYVNCLNLSSYSDLTIQIWIYDTRVMGGFVDILTYNGNTTGGSFSHGGNLFYTDGNNNGGRRITVDGYPPRNEWYQFTYVKNGSLFINLKEYSSSYGSENTYGELDIGRTRTDVRKFLNGNVASVLVYNRALTADEVRQNYEATVGRFT